MISFGVLLGQDRPIAELLDWARRFEDAGVDSVWVADHLASDVDVNSFWYDGWSVLAAVAATTSRCRVGPLVSNFVLHPPLRLARLTTTLDAISNGRLDLGLGMGGQPACRSAAGVFDDGPALADRFETGVDSLLSILDNEPFPLAEVPVLGGRRVRPPAPSSLVFSTPCVQVPRPPILIGGHGPRIIDIAARLGDRWNIYLPPGLESARDLDSALQRIVDRFDERCAVHGRTGEVSRSILLDSAPGLQAATREELAELVSRMSGLGFVEFIATGWPADYPGLTNRATDELLAFVAEDLPALRLRC